MDTICTAAEARERLYHLIDEVSESHQPVTITGKRTNAVLISEEDYRGMQETINLLSIPGMREKILEGAATPIEDCIPYEEVLRDIEKD